MVNNNNNNNNDEDDDDGHKSELDAFSPLIDQYLNSQAFDSSILWSENPIPPESEILYYPMVRHRVALDCSLPQQGVLSECRTVLLIMETMTMLAQSERI